MAEGGEVEHFCSKDQAHKEGCEHFAGGGAVDFVPDGQQSPAPEGPQGSIDFQLDDQKAANEEKYGGLAGMAKTAALGSAEGLAGPLGTMAAREAGLTPEAQEGMKQANPITYYGSKAAGFIAPLVATGGESGLARLTLAGGLESAGKAASELAGVAGAGRVATTAVKLGVENALFAGMDELSKVVNSDPSSIQQAMVHVGLSGLLGAGTGAIFGKAGDLWLSKLGPKADAFVADLQQGLNKFSDSSKDIPQAYDPTYPESPVQEAANRVEDALSSLKNPPKSSPLGSKFADFIYKKASDAASEVASDTAGAMAGQLSGIPGGKYIGGMIGHYGLKPIIKTIMPTLIKPLLDMAPSGEGLKAGFEAINAIAKGDTMLNNISKGLFESGSSTMFSELKPEKALLDKLSDRVDDLSAHPEAMMGVGGSIGHYLPQHQSALASTAQNAINYLNNAKPMPTKPGVLDTPIEPSADSIAGYFRTLGIAQQPLVTMGYMKDGSLKPKDVQDLKALYPALYGSMVQKINNNMIEHMSKDGQVPFKVRSSLSMFTGQPMDNTFTQQSRMAVQSTFMAPQGPQQAQGAPRKKKGTSAMGKAEKMAQTPSESRQEALNKA